MKNLYLEYKTIWDCKNSSGKLKQIKKVIKKYLHGINYQYDNMGNIFIGDFEKNRPCLIAHLDSVFDKKPKNVRLKKGKIKSDTGLGGDDKCGIIAILEILKTNDDINAIFTVDEEIGGIGARGIKKSQIANVQYFIEIDRRDKNDLANTIYGEQIASYDFLDDIGDLIDKYGFELTDGAYSDVLDLSITSNISSINLSAGYYNPHTKDEYVILKELQNTINFVEEILKTTTKKYILPEKLLINDWDDINIPLCLNDVYDLKGLIDVSYVCDYKDIEILLMKAYELGKKESQYALDKW